MFNDAATYNSVDKTGGMNGSVVLNQEEAGRPESADLRDLVARLTKAKQVIDDGNAAIGSGPLSWADTLVLAAKVAVQAQWREIKVKRAATPDGGEQIVKAFGSAWDVRLGRVDSADAAPQRALAPGASAEEMRTFMLKLGAKPDAGPFAAKPPFWEQPAFVVYPATQDDPLVRSRLLCVCPDRMTFGKVAASGPPRGCLPAKRLLATRGNSRPVQHV